MISSQETSYGKQHLPKWEECLWLVVSSTNGSAIGICIEDQDSGGPDGIWYMSCFMLHRNRVYEVLLWAQHMMSQNLFGMALSIMNRLS